MKRAVFAAMDQQSGGYKMRTDAKPINLNLAQKLYWDGGSLRQVSQVFKVDHSNLIMRFKLYRVPLKSKTEAMKDNPLIKGNKSHNWRGGILEKRAYRKIAAKVLGRSLKTNEAVHHWDKNRENNEHSNLLICSRSYHAWLHAKMSNWLIGQNYKQPKEKETF